MSKIVVDGGNYFVRVVEGQLKINFETAHGDDIVDGDGFLSFDAKPSLGGKQMLITTDELREIAEALQALAEKFEADLGLSPEK